MNVKVLLVDDHAMLRKGLRQALTHQTAMTVVGEASTGTAAIALALELAPELIIMDIHLPDMSGIEATRRILEKLPEAKIVFFSGDADQALVNKALQAGARGYVWKQGLIDELNRAAEMVMAGKPYLSPEVSAEIVEGYRRGLLGAQPPPKPLLSVRDKQLLRLVAEGRRNKEIAAELALSLKSVEAYRSRIMKKLDCSSSADLVRYAIREGIASA